MRDSKLASLAILLLLSAATATASPVSAGRADVGDAMAEESFDSFAGQWMERAVARGARDSKAPRARQGTKGLVFTYRAVADDFETELRATGTPNSPWVGVLHYTEQTFTCRDVHGGQCTATSSLPVTEVFRYRAGRWSY